MGKTRGPSRKLGEPCEVPNCSNSQCDRCPPYCYKHRGLHPSFQVSVGKRGNSYIPVYESVETAAERLQTKNVVTPVRQAQANSSHSLSFPVGLQPTPDSSHGVKRVLEIAPPATSKSKRVKKLTRVGAQYLEKKAKDRSIFSKRNRTAIISKSNTQPRIPSEAVLRIVQSYVNSDDKVVKAYYEQQRKLEAARQLQKEQEAAAAEALKIEKESGTVVVAAKPEGEGEKSSEAATVKEPEQATTSVLPVTSNTLTQPDTLSSLRILPTQTRFLIHHIKSLDFTTDYKLPRSVFPTIAMANNKSFSQILADPSKCHLPEAALSQVFNGSNLNFYLGTRNHGVAEKGKKPKLLHKVLRLSVQSLCRTMRKAIIHHMIKTHQVNAVDDYVEMQLPVTWSTSVENDVVTYTSPDGIKFTTLEEAQAHLKPTEMIYSVGMSSRDFVSNFASIMSEEQVAALTKSLQDGTAAVDTVIEVSSYETLRVAAVIRGCCARIKMHTAFDFFQKAYEYLVLLPQVKIVYTKDFYFQLYGFCVGVDTFDHLPRDLKKRHFASEYGKI